MAGKIVKKAGGKIIETSKKDYNLKAQNIKHSAGKNMSQVGKSGGIKFGDA